jgi:hypothetical protein
MINISGTPGDYKSAHEPLWFVVDSTDKNTAGFQYIFDVYKDSQLLARIKNTPYGANKYGVINVSNVVRSTLLDNPFQLTDVNDWTANVYSGADYWFTDCRVEFGQVSGNTITYNDASADVRSYNTYNRAKINSVDSLFIKVGGSMVPSNRPTDSYFYEGEPIVLTVNLAELGLNMEKRIKINGTVTASDTPLTDYALCYFAINDQTEDFTFEYYDLDNSGVAKALNFKKKCTKYKPWTLVFLNCYGGWDSFTFVHGVLSLDNEKKKFERNAYAFSNNMFLESNGIVYNEGFKTYASNIKTKMKLTSDLLNTDEYKWLAELITSPQVYIYDKDNANFYPVQITNTNYEFKDSLINKTEVLEINLDVYDNNTQYR